MPSPLEERLRSWIEPHSDGELDKLLAEAADTLATREREIARLRQREKIYDKHFAKLCEALENLIGANTSIDAGPNELRLAVQSARAALGELE